MSENKQRLNEIMESHDLTNDQVAAIIRNATGSKTNRRTIQKWKADSTVVSSRACPDWVIYLLANELR